MKKHHLNIKFWHQTRFFGWEMSWLSTICISEQVVVGIWQKYVVVTVKNHKNTQKPHLFDKISKINPNYWDLLKGDFFFCARVVKMAFRMQVYLIHQILNYSCVYRKIRSTFSSKIRPINHKNLVSYIFRLIIEIIATQGINISGLK